jgi:Na+-transporting NADH:ubiquinone oxidoreductase subunit NqrB
VSDWIVAKDAIVGTSPMELPDRCVECGRDASGGRRVDTTLYWYPRWIWLGIFWGVIPVVLLYYAARRPLKISYSLCPEDDRSLRTRKRVAIGVWALFVAFLVAAVATHFNRFCVIAAIVLFFGAVIVHFMAVVPLSAAGHEDGVFGIKGFGKDFLSGVERPNAAELGH